MLAYLSGPIEYAEDGGRLWRRKLAPYLREQLGHRVYDPAEDEKKNLSDEEAHRQFDSYPVAQYVLARFAGSKLVYLSASVSGSASVPQNLRVLGF